MMYSYRIEQAIRAAAVLHKDQTRKGKAPFPYVTHLFSVACIIADYTEDEDTIIAGLLHDTLEDTDYTEDELAGDFGEDVRELVLAVTKPPLEEISSGNVWKEMHSQYAEKLKTAPERALIVAAADKIHNMRTTIEEYFEDHDRFMRDFGGSLDDRMRVYQTISNILNGHLKNDILHEFNHVFDEYKNFIHGITQKNEH